MPGSQAGSSFSLSWNVEGPCATPHAAAANGGPAAAEPELDDIARHGVACASPEV